MFGSPDSYDPKGCSGALLPTCHHTNLGGGLLFPLRGGGRVQVVGKYFLMEPSARHQVSNFFWEKEVLRCSCLQEQSRE